MASVAEIREYMEQLAPSNLAASWDNVGTLVDCGTDVTGILVTLDITEEVIEEAVQKNCQLIVSHHPVIFKKLAAIRPSDLVFQMVQKGISAICMHTNLDAAEGGVNDILCELFGIHQAVPFGEDNVGRVGSLEQPATVQQMAVLSKSVLNAHIKMVDAGNEIRKVAVVGGSGGSMWQDARSAGADLFITGEASHHNAIDAKSMGMSLIVAGHHATEFPLVQVLARKLSEHFAQVQVQCSECNKDPYQYL